MAEPALVSVIVPARNAAGTLGTALDSVLAQDYGNLEVLVVDDASEDATAQVARARGDDRLRLLAHPRRRGAAAARNTGMSQARGAWLAFLDADDQWLPGKLSRQVADLERAPEGVRASCTAFVLRRLADGGREVRRPRAEGGGLISLLDGCFLSPGSTLVMAAGCLDRLGPQAEDLPRFEDWDWLLAYCAAHRLAVVPQPLAVVNSGGWPRPDVVCRAARMLGQRKAGLVESLAGPAGRRRFEASLDLEVAIAWARHDRPLRALPWAARAGLRCPGRLLQAGRARLGRGRAPEQPEETNP